MIHHEGEDACQRFRRAGHDQGGQVRPVVCLVKGQHARLHAVHDEIGELMKAWHASASEIEGKALTLALKIFALLVNDYMTLREEQVLWPRAASV
jgi:hypothetical protein